MGDWTTIVGKDMRRRSMGKCGAEEIKNHNGDKITDFCIDNKLSTGNNFSP